MLLLSSENYKSFVFLVKRDSIFGREASIPDSILTGKLWNSLRPALIRINNPTLGKSKSASRVGACVPKELWHLSMFELKNFSSESEPNSEGRIARNLEGVWSYSSLVHLAPGSDRMPAAKNNWECLQSLLWLKLLPLPFLPTRVSIPRILGISRRLFLYITTQSWMMPKRALGATRYHALFVGPCNFSESAERDRQGSTKPSVVDVTWYIRRNSTWVFALRLGFVWSVGPEV